MKEPDPDPDMDENLARCLAARRRLERKFKTSKDWSDFLFRLEKQPPLPPNATLKQIRAWAHPFKEQQAQERAVRTLKAQASKKARHVVKNGRPNLRQAAHKR